MTTHQEKGKGFHPKEDNTNRGQEIETEHENLLLRPSWMQRQDVLLREASVRSDAHLFSVHRREKGFVLRGEGRRLSIQKGGKKKGTETKTKTQKQTTNTNKRDFIALQHARSLARKRCSLTVFV
jgi:hypothetical protein